MNFMLSHRSKYKDHKLTAIKYVVTSQINIIVMPVGPDLTEGVAEQECQSLANSSGKPVRLMYHNKPVKQFNPQ